MRSLYPKKRREELRVITISVIVILFLSTFTSCSKDSELYVCGDVEFTVSTSVENYTVDNMLKSGEFLTFQHLYKESFSLIFTNILGDEYTFNNVTTTTNIILPSGTYNLSGSTTNPKDMGEDRMSYIFKTQEVTINESTIVLSLEAECYCSLIMFKTDLNIERLFITNTAPGVVSVFNLVENNGVMYAYVSNQYPIIDYDRTLMFYNETGDNVPALINMNINELEISKQYKYIYTQGENNIGIIYPDMTDGSF